MTSENTEKDYLNDLDDEQLKAAADYFGTKRGLRHVVIKDLRANGVTQEQFLAAFPPVNDEAEEVVIEPAPGVVTTETLNDVVEDEVVEPVIPVAVAPDPKVLAAADYLIRMVRDNSYFEFKNYKFTDDNPFQIMPARDAQAILTQEEGFRQAFPDEVAEFFDV